MIRSCDPVLLQLPTAKTAEVGINNSQPRQNYENRDFDSRDLKKNSPKSIELKGLGEM